MNSLLCVLPCLLAVALAATTAQAQDVESCRRAMFSGLESAARGQVSQIGRCLSNGNYEACPVATFHSEAHEHDLLNRVSREGSACELAIANGASLSDFGPASCADEWNDCDSVVPAIHSLEDLANCLVCQQRGYSQLVRDAIGLPRMDPTDPDEHRCTKRIAKLVMNAARRSIFDADACSEDLEKPYSCATDTSIDSRFGKALATFEKSIAACGIDEGRAPGVLVNMCGGTATSSADLTTCFRGIARCLACRNSNASLGQSTDCIAESGYADCDGMF